MHHRSVPSQPVCRSSRRSAKSARPRHARFESLEARHVLSAAANLILDILPGDASSNPEGFVSTGNDVYFTAETAATGIELWKTDGTALGTTLVKDISPGPSSSHPANLTAVGNQLFFTATDPQNGTELWQSDGTADGTVMVADVWTGPSNSAPSSLTNVGGTLYFSAESMQRNRELWKTDGTSVGTELVRDIHPAGSSAPDSLTAVGNQLFFVADDGSSGRELWTSDGTSEGTRLVRNIAAGESASSPKNLTPLGSALFFSAVTDTGFELWKSDGTEAGTQLVRDIKPGTEGSNPSLLTGLGSTLYFVANNGSNGAELWRSDGTEAGTVMVRDIFPGPADASVSGLTIVGETLFFAASDGVHGAELWRSNGSTDRTLMVADLVTGSTGSSPAFLKEFKGELYFAASTSRSSFTQQVWASDGTSPGTRVIADARPQSPFTQLGTKGVVFAGSTTESGREPWVIVVIRPPVASAGGDYFIEEGNALTLNGGGSFDPDGDPLTYTWDVNGDGQFGDASGVLPTLSSTQLKQLAPPVADDGVFEITLRVTDTSGVSSEDTVSLTIRNVAPTIRSVVVPRDALEGASLSMTAAAVDPAAEFDPLQYIWDFGDGSQPVQGTDLTNTTHVYAQPGQYNVTLTALDGDGGSDVEAIPIEVQKAPRDADRAANIVNEHSPAGTKVGVTAEALPAIPEGSVSYSLVEDAGGRFAIGDSTGVITVNDSARLDFEAATFHDLTIQANLGGGVTKTNTFTVLVQDVNDAPEITSPEQFTVAESTGTVGAVTAIDQDRDALSFEITGGADQSLFSLTPAGGTLTFRALPNYEEPADSDRNNVYELEITVSDGRQGTDRQLLRVTVDDVNDGPQIISPGEFVVPENSTPIIVLQAVDEDADTLTYQLSGGADRDQFTLNAATGELAFQQPADFELPADANKNNVYVLEVTVTDGQGGIATQGVSITVTNENDPPQIFIDPDARTVVEGTAFVTLVTATDQDRDRLAFSLVGGPDQALFEIGAVTGMLQFTEPPDAEQPRDSDGDGTYVIEVAVLDQAGASATDSLEVTVVNRNEPPNITSSNDFMVQETGNFAGVLQAVDPENDAVRFSLTGGPDRERFTLDADTGLLLFVTNTDFESPTDADQNNVYVVEVTASDSEGAADVKQVAVAVVDVNEAPRITSPPTVEMAENDTQVTVVTADDVDGYPLFFSIVGGADADLFSVDSQTGLLQFRVAPDFEKPTDSDGDNIYVVDIQTRDTPGLTDARTLRITVLNANDPPQFVGGSQIERPESANFAAVIQATDLDQDVVHYTIVGGPDGSRFSLDSATGLLLFEPTPDFEQPGDADRDNVYVVQVAATDDQAAAATEFFSIRVTDENDRPQVLAGGFVVTENVSIVGSVSGLDQDSDALAFGISGGADGGLLIIDENSGLLRFQTAPNFEAPADRDADNIYEVEIVVTDVHGVSSLSTPVHITVTNQNELPSAANDFYVATEDRVLEIDAPSGLLANDTDEDGTSDLTVSSFDAVSLQGAAVAVQADGSFQYDPSGVSGLQVLPAGQFAVDLFSYRITDGSTSDRAVVTLRVMGSNDPPLAGNDTVGISEDTRNVDLTATLLANDSDMDVGQTESLRIIQIDNSTTKGTLVLDRGFVIYTPGPPFDALVEGETATDEFRYTIRDSAGATATATMVVTVIGQSEAPQVTGVLRNQGSGNFDTLSSLSFTFDADVSASLDVTDLTLRNSATGEPADLTGATVEWHAENRTAVWNLADVDIRQAGYLATLEAAAITDAQGKQLDGNADGLGGDDFQATLLVTWAGDADLNLEVDFSDFVILANNFNQLGGWQDANFDANAMVEFSDFVLLANNFGKSFADQPGAASKVNQLAATDAAFASDDTGLPWWMAIGQ